MIRTLILLITLFLVTFKISISQNLTISGFIEDASTNEKLLGASVYELNSKKGTIANNFGFYSLTIPQNIDTVKIYTSFTGYKPQIIILTDKKQTVQNFYLVQGYNEINVITIIAEAQSKINKRLEMSIIEIPMTQVKSLPMLAGEVDVLKAIQLMPGVHSGGEGSSGLYVRGGSPDQNQIILDDVPLYYVNHLGGFVSIFNADAINNIKLVKGGFPAQYGSRLSSVLDVRMKEGNMQKYEIQGSIGLISTKISVEGPIIKDKSSFIISARRFMLDFLMKPISKKITEDATLGYTFYDLNGKLNYKINQNNRIYVSFYNGDDHTMVKNEMEGYRYSSDSKFSLSWGNFLTALRWNHIYCSKIFSNFTLTYTQYRYLSEFEFHSKEFEADTINFSVDLLNKFFSGINDYSLKTDFEYFANSKYSLKFGSLSTLHTFKPNIITFSSGNVNSSDSILKASIYNSLENAVYFENIIKLNKFINFNMGLRVVDYFIENKHFVSFEPRFLSNFLLTNDFSLKASFAQMQQNVHLLTYSGMGMPTDLWIPATKNIPPENSIQYALGFASQLLEDKYEFSLEGYYKKMTNLIEFKEATSFYGTVQNYEDKIVSNGNGLSYGIEMLVQKKRGKFTGWIGYTLSKTTRQFEELNNSKPYLYRYDRTHDISIVFNYQINDELSLAATWVYGTGNAITLSNEYYKIYDLVYNPETSSYYFENTYIIENFSEKNNYRMRSYHRLDIGLNATKQKKWGVRTWNFSIYNAYNRQNPYYYFYKDKFKLIDGLWYPTGTKAVFQQSLFPIIPSVSYSFKF